MTRSDAIQRATLHTMDPKPPGEMLLAPSSQGGALRLPASEDFPPVDARLVKPETREEMVRGRLVVALPANPEHGDRHFKLDYVIGAHVKEGYIGSTDLLTRLTKGSDFATDTCVRRDGIDPTTGKRYLEELAFEIVNEQSERDATERAEDLTARGVRRVIGVFVQTGEVREWLPSEARVRSTKRGGWRRLDPNAILNDSTLARPLRVRELLDAAEADRAVVQALKAKGNPAITEVRDEGRAEGRAEGLRAAVRDLCEVLDVPITPEHEGALARMQSAELDALRARLKRDRRWE